MPAVRHCSRIDTFELKVQMERILGSQKAEKYFSLLTRYLSLKLEKSEFDLLCIRLIGKENVVLHNELVRAILKNVTVSKTPPPKKVKRDGLLALKDSNGIDPRSGLNGIVSCIDPRSGLQSPVRDAFSQSPINGRTQILCKRKFEDTRSSITVDVTTHVAEDLATTKGKEQERASELLSFGRYPLDDVISMKDGEGVEQEALVPSINRRIQITAPFGINIHTNKKRKVLCRGSESAYYTCHYSGHLPGDNYLEKRLKENLKMKGLDISMDCMKLLNNGLDSYLKGVVKQSLQVAHSRSLQMPGTRFTTSMADFKIATRSKPIIHGEDWSVQLEHSLFVHDQSAGDDSSL